MRHIVAGKKNLWAGPHPKKNLRVGAHPKIKKTNEKN
jgi:hypothetical protein